MAVASFLQATALERIIEFLGRLPNLAGPADASINTYLFKLPPSEIRNTCDAIKAAHLAIRSKWGVPGKHPEVREINLHSYIVEALQSTWLELYLIDAAARRIDTELYIFCHIPKCAGTKIVHDFSSNYQDNCLAYCFVRQAQFWVSKWQRINDKKDFAKKVLSVKVMLLYGHIPLYRIRRSGLDQKAKLLFTTLREPVEIIHSHVNYILTCIENVPDRPDSRNWIRRFAQEGVDLGARNTGLTHEHGISLLYSSYFRESYANPISKYLLPESLLSAPENILSHVYHPSECKLVLIDRLDIIYGYLGLDQPEPTTVNKSEKYLDIQRLSDADVSFMMTHLVNHDIPLWGLINRHLYWSAQNDWRRNILNEEHANCVPEATRSLSATKSRIEKYLCPPNTCVSGDYSVHSSLYSSGAAIRYAKRSFGCEDREKAYKRYKRIHVRLDSEYDESSGWERSGFFQFVYPVSKILALLNSSLYVAVVIHDNTSSWNRPVIARSRRSRNADVTLLKLQEQRHWMDTLDACRSEGSFQSKQDILLFRGATTGKQWLKHPQGVADIQSMSARSALYHFLRSTKNEILEAHGIDLGFSKLTPAPFRAKSGFETGDLDDYTKGFMPLVDILDFRYQLVLEGNDVSTGLKAILASHCVPFMPPPTTESWLLEFDLKPWVHFVPVRPDLSDIFQRLSFLRAHPLDAEAIALAGRSYMSQFLNAKRERDVQMRVLKRFISSHRPYLVILKQALQDSLLRDHS